MAVKWHVLQKHEWNGSCISHPRTHALKLETTTLPQTSQITTKTIIIFKNKKHPMTSSLALIRLMHSKQV